VWTYKYVSNIMSSTMFTSTTSYLHCCIGTTTIQIDNVVDHNQRSVRAIAQCQVCKVVVRGQLCITVWVKHGKSKESQPSEIKSSHADTRRNAHTYLSHFGEFVSTRVRPTLGQECVQLLCGIPIDCHAARRLISVGAHSSMGHTCDRGAKSTQLWGACRRRSGGRPGWGCARMPVDTCLYLHAVGASNHVAVPCLARYMAKRGTGSYNPRDPRNPCTKSFGNQNIRKQALRSPARLVRYVSSRMNTYKYTPDK
jgi:hypothetical protein